VTLAVFAALTTAFGPRGAFAAGWVFGLGLLGFGIAWIRISLNQFGNLDAPLAWLLTLLFIAAMALYFGLAGWLLRRLRTESLWLDYALLFPSLWALTEWVRGWFLTGFPWLSIGYSQIDSPLAGYAPLLGVYGLSWLTALSAGLCLLAYGRGGRQRLAPLLLLALVWLGGAALKQVSWTGLSDEPLRVTLVQANIPQSVKWDPDRLLPTLRAYLALTHEHWASDLIVWPETAVPEFEHRVRDSFLEPLGEKAAAEGAELILGLPVMDLESGRYYNAVASLGSVSDRYFKRHLVPFGEFLPLKHWLGPLVELFDVPMSDFSAGDARRPLLRVGDGSVGASVCYEDVFPEEVIEALPDARYLVNVSNDAWFGDSLAPHQHLEIARMRALETGRFLLRATNTGISAILGPDGAVLSSLPLDKEGVVTGVIRSAEGSTPFSRWVNLPVVVGSVVVLLGAGMRGRLRRDPR